MNVAVRMRNVNVSFDGRDVVRDVDLELPGPGISVLIGRSGSGKTTILRALNRLNEEFPACVTTGQIEADLGEGLETIWPAGRTDRPLPELRRRVGMVFQTPNVFPASIYRNLAIPLEFAAECPKDEVADRVRAALEAVRLWEEVRGRLNAPAGRLSGGQQQRLCLARTLALEPALLLLDEPTASLDVHATRDVEALLGDLADRYPVIMVSHSLAQARRLARRLILVEEGRADRHFDEGHFPSEEALATLLFKTAHDNK